MQSNSMMSLTSAGECRAGQYNSYAFGGYPQAASPGGQGHSDNHPPALFPPLPDA